jgi:hypothetical protein
MNNLPEITSSPSGNPCNCGRTFNDSTQLQDHITNEHGGTEPCKRKQVIRLEPVGRPSQGHGSRSGGSTSSGSSSSRATKKKKIKKMTVTPQELTDLVESRAQVLAEEIAKEIAKEIVKKEKKEKEDLMKKNLNAKAFLLQYGGTIAERQRILLSDAKELELRTTSFLEFTPQCRNPLLPKLHGVDMEDQDDKRVYVLESMRKDMERLLAAERPDWKEYDENYLHQHARTQLPLGRLGDSEQDASGSTTNVIFNRGYEDHVDYELFAQVNPDNQSQCIKEIMKIVFPELENCVPPFWHGQSIQRRVEPGIIRFPSKHQKAMAKLTHSYLKKFDAIEVIQAPRYRPRDPNKVSNATDCTKHYVTLNTETNAHNPCAGAANLPAGGDKMIQADDLNRIRRDVFLKYSEGYWNGIAESELDPATASLDDLKLRARAADAPCEWFLRDFDSIENPNTEAKLYVDSNFRPDTSSLMEEKKWYIRILKIGYNTVYVITYGDESDVKGTWSSWIGTTQMLFLPHQHKMDVLEEKGITQVYLDEMSWNKHIGIMACVGSTAGEGSKPLALALAQQFHEEKEMDLLQPDDKIITYSDLQEAIRYSCPPDGPLPEEITSDPSLDETMYAPTGMNLKQVFVGNKGDFKELGSINCTRGPNHTGKDGRGCRGYGLCDCNLIKLGWPSWISPKRTTGRGKDLYLPKGGIKYNENGLDGKEGDPLGTIAEGGLKWKQMQREVEARRGTNEGEVWTGVPWDRPDNGQARRELTSELKGQQGTPILADIGSRSKMKMPDCLHINGALAEILYKLGSLRATVPNRDLCELWLVAVCAKKKGKMRKVDWQYVLNALALPHDYHSNSFRPEFGFSDIFYAVLSALLECIKYSNRKPVVSAVFANHLGFVKAYEDLIYYMALLGNTDQDGNPTAAGVEGYYPGKVTEKNFFSTYLDGMGALTDLGILLRSIIDASCHQEEREFQTLKKEAVNTNQRWDNFKDLHDPRNIARNMLKYLNEPPRQKTSESRQSKEYRAILEQDDKRFKSFPHGMDDGNGNYIGEIHSFETGRVANLAHIVTSLCKRARMIVMQNDADASSGTVGVVEFWRDDPAHGGNDQYDVNHVVGWSLLCDFTLSIPQVNIAYWDVESSEEVYENAYITLVLENAPMWRFPGFEYSKTRVFWFEIIQQYIRNKRAGWKVLLKKLVTCGCSKDAQGVPQLPQKALRAIAAARQVEDDAAAAVLASEEEVRQAQEVAAAEEEAARVAAEEIANAGRRYSKRRNTRRPAKYLHNGE